MARHRKYSRKRRGQRNRRMRSRKMRGGFDDDYQPNTNKMTIEELTSDDDDDEDKKRPSPFDSPKVTKERKRQNIGPKEILRYDDSDSDEDEDEPDAYVSENEFVNDYGGGKRRRKRRRTNKRKTKRTKKTRKNRKRRQRGGIVI